VPDSVAAVDLGSNSFHLVVARVEGGHPEIVDRVRERVALAAGFDPEKRLTPEIQARALACIERFAQRLRDMPRGSVRAVGTNALRQARNAREFLERAEGVLGHPIEVISGPEEARLIYLGVAHHTPAAPGRRLVIDIGGGSTECILGEGFEPLLLDSLYMGCVGHSLRHFPRGEVTKDAFRRAQIAALLEVQPLEWRYKAAGWSRCVGASGTILAIEEILRGNGWSDDGITRKGLSRLRKEMVAAGRVDRFAFRGLPEERRPVLPGGAAILLALFEGLHIDRMETSAGALREGLLYDFLGRRQHEDARDLTIRRMVERWQVDAQQAARVERTALGFLDQVAADWDLAGEEPRLFLGWAARLHELGRALAFSGHHRHGAYVVQHADMPGFSRQDQAILAAILGAHRQKISRKQFRDLPRSQPETALKLAVLLRLAVHLHRARSPRPPPEVRLRARRGGLEARFPEGWFEEHALSRLDLSEEIERLAAVDVRLELR